MKAIEVRGLINAAPDAVWSLLGDFRGVASWNPFVERADITGEGVGMTRTIRGTGGGVVIETLELRDEPERRIRYAVELSTGARSTADIRLEDAPDGGTAVIWYSIREADLDPEQRDAVISTLQSRIAALGDAVSSH